MTWHPMVLTISFAVINNLDKIIRDRGVTSLEHFLATNTNFSELGFLKIWKALFYCFWHSDKTVVQQQLAHRLSKMQHALQPSAAMMWMSAFWRTMNREWRGIDKLRLDKFYSLCRYFLNQSFVYLIEKDWPDLVVESFACIMNPRCRELYQNRTDNDSIMLIGPGDQPIACDSQETPIEGPLSLDASRGLLLHILGLYLDELEKALQDDSIYSLRPEVLSGILVPVVHLFAWTQEKLLLQRVHDSIFGGLLARWAGFTEIDPIEPKSDAHDQRSILVHSHILHLSEFLLNIGASPKINSSNRSAIYRSRTLYCLCVQSIPLAAPLTKKRKSTGTSNSEKRVPEDIQRKKKKNRSPPKEQDQRPSKRAKTITSINKQLNLAKTITPISKRTRGQRALDPNQVAPVPIIDTIMDVDWSTKAGETAARNGVPVSILKSKESPRYRKRVSWPTESELTRVAFFPKDQGNQVVSLGF